MHRSHDHNTHTQNLQNVEGVTTSQFPEHDPELPNLEDKENVSPGSIVGRRRGKPLGSKNSRTLESERKARASLAAAEKRRISAVGNKRAREDHARTLRGPLTRRSSSGCDNNGTPSPRTPPPPPANDGKRLTDDHIEVILRVIHRMMDEAPPRGASAAMEEAAKLCGIGVTTAKTLWAEYKDLDGRELPRATTGEHSESRRREGRVTRADYGPLRAEVRRLRLESGHAVEIPDIVKWFAEKRDKIVTRFNVRYAMTV